MTADIAGASKARDTPLRQPHVVTAEEGADQLRFGAKVDAILRAKGIEPEKMPPATSVIDGRRRTKLFLVIEGS